MAKLNKLSPPRSTSGAGMLVTSGAVEVVAVVPSEVETRIVPLLQHRGVAIYHHYTVCKGHYW